MSTHRSGRTTVTVGDELRRVAARAASLQVQLAFHVERRVAETVQQARRAWPVDTGRSLRALTVRRVEAAVAVDCPVPYARYLPAVGDLLVQIVAARDRLVVDDLGPAAVRHLEGG